MSNETRAFAKRFAPRMKGTIPNMLQVGDYTAVNHTLKAVAAMGVPAAKASGRALIPRMKAVPVEDDVYGKLYICADGWVMNPMPLFQVKSPAESRHPGTITNLFAP